jgi:hypothetical protein
MLKSMDLRGLLKLAPNKQGIFIDVLVIIINLFLFPAFFGRLEGLFQGAFENKKPAFIGLGILMLLILAGRLVGLYLKRFPLQKRMQSSDASFSAYFLVFSAPIMILTGVGAAVALQYFAAALGLIAVGADGQPTESRAVSMIVVFSILLLAGVEIYLMVRLGKRLNTAQSADAAKGGVKYGAATEAAADFGLFAYMTIWQAVYYMVAETLLNPPSGNKLDWDTWIFGLFVMLICFGLFYLSPRAVFLTEDRKYLSTWIFIALVFISSLLPHSWQRITSALF